MRAKVILTGPLPFKEGEREKTKEEFQIFMGFPK